MTRSYFKPHFAGCKNQATTQCLWDKHHIPKTQKWQCNFGFLGAIGDQQRDLNDTNAKLNSIPVQINSPQLSTSLSKRGLNKIDDLHHLQIIIFELA